MTSARADIIGGRAATGSCYPGSSASRAPDRRRQANARRIASHRSLEDDRQSASDPVRAHGRSRPAVRLDLANSRRARLDGLRSWNARACPASFLCFPPSMARRPGVSLPSHIRALGGDLRLAATLSTLNLVFLADQACLMSRRHRADALAALRQPSTFAGMDSRGADDRRRPSRCQGLFRPNVRSDAARVARQCWSRSRLGITHGCWRRRSPRFGSLSPAVARYTSLPPGGAGLSKVSETETQALRRTARLTWRFFETFVTPEDNMLPPDNFQEDPAPALAHRTSPTNIGLYLLSVVSARDFGWIGTTQAIERLEASLATMIRMPRFRGHFYNWYDTRDLKVLEPKYVSSVDSGNLAGHLIALANACREWRESAPDRAVAPRRHSRHARLDHRKRRPPAYRSKDPDRDATAVGRVAGLPDQDDRGRCDRPKRPSPRNLRNSPESAKSWSTLRARSLSNVAMEPDRISCFGREQAFRRSPRIGGTWRLRVPELAARDARLTALEAGFRAMAMAMEFGFLFDAERQLLSIGYLNSESALDPNCYDLLASEARLASFFAIAKGDIPARHWFRLGRTATPVSRGAALISWSGSMFEYLMPPLVMRAPDGQPARTDRPVDRSAADRIWREEWTAVGHFRIGVQRSRSGTHLPIFQFRRARTRVETRIGRKQRRGALCDWLGDDGRSFRLRRELEPACGDGRARSLWFLRGRGFHARLAFTRTRHSRSCAPIWRITRA